MLSHPQDVAERLEFAVAIAREAGDVTLKYFRRTDLKVDQKSDATPVTIADRSAEELLRERISKRYGNDAIYGEEFGEQSGTTGFQWTLDPIDGTKSFIHGVPLFTNLVAVLFNNEPVIGVINAPILGETVYAAKGKGCWHLLGDTTKPQPARVSKTPRLCEGLFVTSEVLSFETLRQQDTLDVFIKLQRAARLTRTWGDAYGYLLVATGRAELAVDPQMSLWDSAPLQTVIEEAGGFFGDWNGNPTIHAGESIATNGLITEEVLVFTRGR